MSLNNKFRFLTLCIFLTHFFTKAFSQSNSLSLSGAIADSASEKGLAFVSVELHRSIPASGPIKITLTADDGKFIFQGVDTGHYVLLISHTGYAVKKHSFSLDRDSLDLGTIYLPVSGDLKAVIVQSRKPLIEQRDDKIIFNVENDPASKTENAISLLRKTPFVSVDGDDNIQLNGQGNFKVLLNGRETAMFSRNLKEALRGFPGALITRIEVITSPSSKWEAEGVGGIINIITLKKIVGYNGYVSLNINSIGTRSGNTSFSAKYGKLAFTINYSAGVSRSWGSTYSHTIPLAATNYLRRSSRGQRHNNSFFNFGNGEFNFAIDSLNTIAVYGNISGGRGDGTTSESIVMEYENSADATGLFYMDNRNIYPSKSLGADFIHKYKGKAEKEWSLRFNSQLSNNEYHLNSVLDNELSTDNYTMSDSRSDNREYTLQTDFINPFTKGRKIEIGAKAILRRASSDFGSQFRETTNEPFIESPDNTDNFVYNQDVYSIYSTYYFKIKKTAFRIGTRIEHTEVLGNFTALNDKVKQSYTNVMPNLLATWRYSNVLTFIFSYGNRIQRPSISSLNPFRINNDPYNISYGNPKLNPQLVHTIALQGRVIRGGTFAGLAVSGIYSDNMILRYTELDKATGVLTTRTENIGREVQVGIYGNMSTKINPKWNIFFNGGIRYNRVQNLAASWQRNSGFSGSGSLSTNYTLTRLLTLSGNTSVSRNTFTLQSQNNLNISYGVTGSLKLFRQRGGVNLSMNNFLHKERATSVETITPYFESFQQFTFPYRNFLVSVSWTFGKLKENVSKKRGIVNDDQVGGN